VNRKSQLHPSSRPRTATVADEDVAELTCKIYEQLHRQCVLAWTDYLRKKELMEVRKAQEDFIVKALADISKHAPVVGVLSWCCIVVMYLNVVSW